MDCFDKNFQVGKSNIFITAEIGINHNGDLNIAKELIEKSKEIGVDAVKFQKRTIKTVYSEESLNTYRESPWGSTQREQKLGLEFNENDYDQIDKFCKEIGIIWYASAWDVESQIFLQKYNHPINKIASAMATNLDFVDFVAQEKKPTFASTGMCTLSQIDKLVKIFANNDCPLVLLHTNSEYPSPESNLNLSFIKSLQSMYNLNIGYSGHEVSVSPSLISVVLGAVAVERHITLDRSMYGSDQSASLEPRGFKSLVDMIRKFNSVYGDGKKKITDNEIEIAKKLRYWEQ
tara:strand:+ start:2328 stop:3197 length:870 start_codon:yes stop_codon:yes gene_type:complete